MRLVLLGKSFFRTYGLLQKKFQSSLIFLMLILSTIFDFLNICQYWILEKCQQTRMEEDRKLFQENVLSGTKNVMSSSKFLFEPKTVPITISITNNFSQNLEDLFEQAPYYTPVMEETLEYSRESVRQFIKSVSQLFGSISSTLENSWFCLSNKTNLIVIVFLLIAWSNFLFLAINGIQLLDIYFNFFLE